MRHFLHSAGQQLKQMTTAFKSKDIFCTQQKEAFERQIADIEGKLYKTQDELRIMKMSKQSMSSCHRNTARTSPSAGTFWNNRQSN